MPDQIPAQRERQCEHSDVRYFADEKGAVACMVCGRLFGHLRGDTFVAYNTSGKGPGPNTGASSEDQGEAVGSAENGAPSRDAASPATEGFTDADGVRWYVGPNKPAEGS